MSLSHARIDASWPVKTRIEPKRLSFVLTVSEWVRIFRLPLISAHPHLLPVSLSDAAEGTIGTRRQVALSLAEFLARGLPPVDRHRIGGDEVAVWRLRAPQHLGYVLSGSVAARLGGKSIDGGPRPRGNFGT